MSNDNTNNEARIGLYELLEYANNISVNLFANVLTCGAAVNNLAVGLS